MRRAIACLALAACGGSDPGPPCQEASDRAVDLVPADVEWGAFNDGDDLPYGNPPQGGAPYSPFRVRVGGLARLSESAHVTLSATDQADGTPLGDIAYDMRFTCANVGDSAGMWMAPDVHLRFEGKTLDDLAGRQAEVTVEVIDPDGDHVDTAIVGQLVLME